MFLFLSMPCSIGFEMCQDITWIFFFFCQFHQSAYISRTVLYDIYKFISQNYNVYKWTHLYHTYHKTKLNGRIPCHNSLFLETSKGCHIHISLLWRTSHLLASKASPVPAQHIVDPPRHGLMAVTDDCAAFDFILQPNEKKWKTSYTWARLSGLFPWLPFTLKMHCGPLPAKIKTLL